MFEVRSFQDGDADALVQLWKDCRLTRDSNDPYLDIQLKRAIQPDLLVVGTLEGRIVASVMAGYEGHRGWFNIGERIIPINFSCISSLADTRDIEKLFVQFVSRGQCSEFIESLGEHVEIVTTDSNTLALTRMTGDPGKSAAIVPSHFVGPGDFPLVITNINDYPNNQTRFFVLAAENTNTPDCTSPGCKTSLIIINDDDHPGLLEKILSAFSKQRINLLAITSRPTREQFGKYHFFIGLAGSQNDIRVINALEEIGKISRVKILGSYERAL